MHASRNDQELKKRIPGKKRQTSSRQCDIEFLGSAHPPRCNQIVLVSYNMVDGFKKERADTRLTHEYHIPILSTQTQFSAGHWIFG